MIADTVLSVEEMTAWLTETVAEYANILPAEIDAGKPLSDYGLDSVSAFAVIAEIEDSFDIVPDVTVVWDYPTVNALAPFLVDLVRTGKE